MKRLLTVFFLAALLPAQDHVDPPDDNPPHAASCAGCENNSGALLNSSTREGWRFIPNYYNGPGKCYPGCTSAGCRNSGSMKFLNGHLGSVLNGGSGPMRSLYLDGQYKGVVAAGECSEWFEIAFFVGCGSIAPPRFLAFDPLSPTTSYTSGWIFLCGDCWPTDDDRPEDNGNDR